MEFDKLKTTQKGYIGEEEVDNYLRSRGIVPYAPIEHKAHPFDRLCATADKKKIFIAETKAKARRTYYPDTGINISNYEDYKSIKNIFNIDVWLFFVDEHTASIYGNLLSELEKPRTILVNNRPVIYPLRQPDYKGKGIIYFPLEAMITICKISEDIAFKLKQLSTRNYGY